MANVQITRREKEPPLFRVAKPIRTPDAPTNGIASETHQLTEQYLDYLKNTFNTKEQAHFIDAVWLVLKATQDPLSLLENEKKNEIIIALNLALSTLKALETKLVRESQDKIASIILSRTPESLADIPATLKIQMILPVLAFIARAGLTRLTEPLDSAIQNQIQQEFTAETLNFPISKAVAAFSTIQKHIGQGRLPEDFLDLIEEIKFACNTLALPENFVDELKVRQKNGE